MCKKIIYIYIYICILYIKNADVPTLLHKAGVIVPMQVQGLRRAWLSCVEQPGLRKTTNSLKMWPTAYVKIAQTYKHGL